MGIMDLLLKKGRGVGELKKFANEHKLNANIIKVMKELDSIDQEANIARSKKDYAKMLSCIRRQLSFVEQVEYFALVRMIRLEYDYKDIGGVIGQYEKHYNNEVKKLKIEEVRLLRDAKTAEPAQVQKIKTDVENAKNHLKHFNNKLSAMKDAIKSLRKIIKESCKKKIIKIKKVYYFA